MGSFGLIRSMRLGCPSVGLCVALATGPTSIHPLSAVSIAGLFQSNPLCVERRCSNKLQNRKATRKRFHVAISRFRICGEESQ
jgi:hypothetical protein